MTATRLVLVGVRTHLRYLARSRISMTILLATPAVYVVVGSYLYRAGGRPGDVVRAGVAAGLMGIWSAVLSNSGTAVHRQRWTGTLELIMVAPARLILTLVSIVLAPTVIGLASMLVALACTAVFFGVTVPAAAAVPFVVAVLLCALSTAAMGLAMATTFVLFRNPYAVVNAIEIPVWILSGMMVPLTVVPGWARSVSVILPSRWGVELVDDAVAGSPVLAAAVGTVVVTAAYVVAAALFVRRVETRARALGNLHMA